MSFGGIWFVGCKGHGETRRDLITLANCLHRCILAKVLEFSSRSCGSVFSQIS